MSDVLWDDFLIVTHVDCIRLDSQLLGPRHRQQSRHLPADWCGCDSGPPDPCSYDLYRLWRPPQVPRLLRCPGVGPDPLKTWTLRLLHVLCASEQGQDPETIWEVLSHFYHTWVSLLAVGAFHDHSVISVQGLQQAVCVHTDDEFGLTDFDGFDDSVIGIHSIELL